MQAIFLGSKSFGLSILQALLAASPGLHWTLLHPDDSADARSDLPRFRAFAEQQGLALHVVSSAKAARQLAAELKPDIAFICGWYWLLDATFLEAIPRGVFGIHNSLLPSYRGGAPLVWAIINGEAQVGSTVFRILPGMDDGPILHQVRLDLGPNDTIRQALDGIESRLLAELPARWQALLQDKAVLCDQEHGAATYCGQRLPEDGRIDWHQPAARLHDFIRAQSLPYPGAFTRKGEETIVIETAQPESGVWHGTPGQVLLRGTGFALVACGGGSVLRITQLRGHDAVERVLDSVKLRLA